MGERLDCSVLGMVQPQPKEAKLNSFLWRSYHEANYRERYHGFGSLLFVCYIILTAVNNFLLNGNNYFELEYLSVFLRSVLCVYNSFFKSQDLIFNALRVCRIIFLTVYRAVC